MDELDLSQRERVLFWLLEKLHVFTAAAGLTEQAHAGGTMGGRSSGARSGRFGAHPGDCNVCSHTDHIRTERIHAQIISRLDIL